MHACNGPIVPFLLFGIFFLLAVLVLATLIIAYQVLGTVARFNQIMVNLQIATSAIAIGPILDYLVG